MCFLPGPEAIKDVVPALIQALQDPDPEVGYNVAEALIGIGKDAVPALIEALQDAEGFVRASAADALGSIGESAIDAAPALIKTLQDPEVRWHAEGALTKIGKGAVPALIQALQDEQVEVRVSAVRTLGSIGEGAKDAIPALMQLLQDKDQSLLARRTAAKALQKIAQLLGLHDVLFVVADVKRRENL